MSVVVLRRWSVLCIVVADGAGPLVLGRGALLFAGGLLYIVAVGRE